MRAKLERGIAIIALTLIYGFVAVFSMIMKPLLRRPRRTQRIIINGTFHNPNWFHAHIAPICQSGYGEVLLVCDEVVDPLPNLTYRCPPDWAMKLMTRAGAKFVWTVLTGIQYPADIFIGYHIFPSAVTALFAARLTGAKAMYQVTAGPLELEGGGWNAENRLMRALGGPSAWVERMAAALTNQFELVIVRGGGAKQYVQSRGFRNQVEIVTGSVDANAEFMQPERDIDILFVGRLAEYKRPDRFVEIVGQLVQRHPELKVKMAGDGPDREALEAQVKRLGAAANLEFLGKRSDVPALMGRAKILVLTSRWEGVSIAMLEAMALAVVPVVSDVGDLRDFAINDETGFVLGEDDLAGFVDTLDRLLNDSVLRERLAHNARQKILTTCERSVLAKTWLRVIEAATV